MPRIRKTHQTSSELKLHSRIIVPSSAKASDLATYVADADCRVVLSSNCSGRGLTSPLAPIGSVSRIPLRCFDRIKTQRNQSTSGAVSDEFGRKLSCLS